jgi:hypothetical protein
VGKDLAIIERINEALDIFIGFSIREIGIEGDGAVEPSACKP